MWPGSMCVRAYFAEFHVVFQFEVFGGRDKIARLLLAVVVVVVPLAASVFPHVYSFASVHSQQIGYSMHVNLFVNQRIQKDLAFLPPGIRLRPYLRYARRS